MTNLETEEFLAALARQLTDKAYELNPTYIYLDPKDGKIKPTHGPATSRVDETTLCPHCRKTTPSRYLYCLQCAKRIDREEAKRRIPPSLRRRPGPPKC